MGRVEAIICVDDAGRAAQRQIINGSRRKRIAQGSGTSVEEVNRLLKQFSEMKKVLQMMGGRAACRSAEGDAGRLAAACGRADARRRGGKKRKKGGPGA